MQIVTLKNVSKSYHGVTVVDDLSLEVASGEIVALLGQTGAGKSTIMNMIMGQTAPTSGEIRVHNSDPRGDDAGATGLCRSQLSDGSASALADCGTKRRIRLGIFAGAKNRAASTRARLA